MVSRTMFAAEFPVVLKLGSDATSSDASPAKDALGKLIWTHKEFNWAVRCPTVLNKGNDYVTEMWSEDYFIGCKKGVGLVKEAARSAFASLKKGNICHGLGHTGNMLIVAAKLAVNIELGNLIKGLLGILLSMGKMVQHSCAAAFNLVLCLLFLLSGQGTEAKKHGLHTLDNFGFIFKDIATMITCIGHAIPSWAPAVVMAVFPPAGVALAVVKIATRFTGAFDVMGYGGTACLLGARAYFAKRQIGKLSGLAKDEAERVVASWESLKKELNPLKSFEGATLAIYGVNILTSAAAAVVDAFVPGAGHAVLFGKETIQKVAGYGVDFAAAGALYGTVALDKTRATAAA